MSGKEMMDKSVYNTLEKAMCKELEAIEQKLKGGSEMTTQDLEKIDKLTHAMKSLATYKAMKMAEEYEEGYGEEGNGMSGYRGRANNGRFVSRTGNGAGDGMNGNMGNGASGAENMNPTSGAYPMDYGYSGYGYGGYSGYAGPDNGGWSGHYPIGPGGDYMPDRPGYRWGR